MSVDVAEVAFDNACRAYDRAAIAGDPYPDVAAEAAYAETLRVAEDGTIPVEGFVPVSFNVRIRKGGAQ